MYYTIPGTTKSVKLQSGEFWSLTCSTKLVGTATDIGVVTGGKPNKTLVEDNAKEIDFNLDIMCCDPNETNCKKCESTDLSKIPIMKVGPNSDANASQVVNIFIVPLVVTVSVFFTFYGHHELTVS